MLETFLATVSPMMVMFLCILIGFGLKRTRVAPENTATVLSKLEIYVLLPAQILMTFLKYCTLETIRDQYRVVLYGCVAIALSVLMGCLLFRLFSKENYERRIYRYSLIIANTGFLGSAIVPQIMGEAALYTYMLFSLPLNVVLYSWCINTLVPEKKGEKKALWKRLLNPTMIALAAGILLGISGAGSVLPGFALTTLEKLSGCMGPIAMVLTGFVVGGYDLKELLKNKRVYIVSALRLTVLPCVIVACLVLLGADRNTALMAMFAYGAALGLNTVVIPAAHDGDTHTGAAMALISHVGAVVTIPLLYALLTQIL